ncbi:hypothetical protein V6N13_097744 [Hibiscus sabdariffa]
MGCLYSVFDAKKQGKPAWVVRTRNWKLRGGENRLSGLLEGVSHVVEILALRGAFLKPCNDLERGIPQASMIVTTLRGAFLKPLTILRGAFLKHR